MLHLRTHWWNDDIGYLINDPHRFIECYWSGKNDRSPTVIGMTAGLVFRVQVSRGRHTPTSRTSSPKAG